MKLRIVLLGVIIGLAAQAADKPKQGAQPTQSASKDQKSMVGCIDEKDGQYILLDDQMVKITSLRSAGSDKEVFAKHLGRRVQVSGTQLSEQEGAFRVTSIKEEAGNCGQAK